MQAQGIAPSRLEQRRDWNQPATPPRRGGEIVVADGYGLRIRVQRGQLLIEDGAGRNRRNRLYTRVDSRLERLVVLGGSGTLSLDAIRWLTDQGAALVCIDRDSRLLCSSSPHRSEAKLRRAQALAPYTPAGLEVARMLLQAKLQGQQDVLQLLPADTYADRVLRDSLQQLDQADTLQQLVNAEAEAAAAYWGCWQEVEVRFRPGDRDRVPEQWRRFGQRTSPLGGGPRMAVTPAGAILNYAYSLLEAEAGLACRLVGLDPALAVIHSDQRGRDSMPLDLMEAVRPSVDRYLHNLLTDRVFQARDFHQTRRGSCRLLPPLTHQLAETLPAWRRLLAPVAEQTCRLLLETDSAGVELPTPLTQANRRADRARRHHHNSRPAPVRPVKPERRCKRCGGPLPHRERVYCDACLPHYQQERYRAWQAAGHARKREERDQGVDPSHGGQAAARRSATVSRRQQELHAWTQQHPGDTIDRSVFSREILPAIQGLPLSALARATGLSVDYVARIRRGEKIPHPRHWPALRIAATGIRRGNS